MSEGVVKLFCFSFFGMISVLFAADDPLQSPLGADPTGIITNTASLTIGATNSPAGEVLPIVEGGTNTVLSAEERKNAEFEKARKEQEEAYQKKLAEEEDKWTAATNKLGVYHLIPERNPFKLIKQEIEKPTVRIVSTTTVGVPHLAGISMLRNNMRAVLRINPLGGGPAEYKFIPVGEMVDGVEVLKIDPKGGIVEVRVKNKTHSLELDKNTLASFQSTTRRPSGLSFRQGSNRPSRTSPRGGSLNSRMDESRKRREEAQKKNRDSGSSPRRPSSSGGGGLKGVPRRGGGKQGNLDTLRPIGSDLYELPAFNEVVQKRVIDPLNISTQREIIRGQLSYETPTDLPRDKR